MSARMWASMSVLAALALAATACNSSAAHPARPVVDISPRGTMLLTGVGAPGFGADLRLVRSIPSASGEDTVDISWQVESDAADNLPPQRIAESEDPNVVIVGVSTTATVIPLLGGVVNSIGGAIKDSRGLLGGWSGGKTVQLPSGTRSLRVTFHLGRTPALAHTGGAVTVPISAIPVLDDIKGFYPFGFSPTF
jgi:hypothetical protein